MISKNHDFDLLARRIITCSKCPRLRRYCEHVGKKKKREYLDWDYWTSPLPGFGDINAKLLVVGLAPAANGGTRTGRLFCGDSSGDWLVKALYETGFANQSFSVSKSDGLVLSDVYLSAVVRCAPPENKPTGEEIANCLPYLGRELRILRDLEVVLVLGQVALDGFIQVIVSEYGLDLAPKPKFRHGAYYDLGSSFPKLFVSYHPSRRNTQTKMLTWEMWITNFRSIRRILDKDDGTSLPKRTSRI